MARKSEKDRSTEVSENGLPLDAEEPEALPTGAKLVTLMATLLLCCFLAAIDMTIVATAVPSITEAFQSLDDVGWYGSAFFLTQATFQPTWGKVYSTFDLRMAFASSIIVLEAGCLVSALAGNSVTMIVGRAIAGVGAAGVIGGVFTIIAFAASEEYKTICIGIIGVSFSIASVVGPLVGGVLTTQLTWRWVFWINLPLGGAALIVLFLVYRTPQTWKDARIKQGWKSALLHLDFLGTALILAALVCFLLVMQRAGITWAWNSARVIDLLVLSPLLVALFCWNEWAMGDRAMVIVRLLRRRTIWINCAYVFFLFGIDMPLIYFLPIYFQAIQGVDAQQSGVRNIPFILAISVLTIGSTYFMGKTGKWMAPLVVGAVVTTAGAATIFTLDIDSTAGQWIGYQLIAGIGVGISMEVAMVANQRHLPPADVPAVIGLTIFSELSGAALFVSVGENIFTNRLLQNVARLAPDVDPAAVLAHGGGNIGDAFGQSSTAVVESFMLALKSAFALVLGCAGMTVALSILIITVTWLSRGGSSI